MPFHRKREGGDVCAIFVHAGAGFHSFANEKHHLAACQDAAKVAMTVLKNGGGAVDAVEMAIKILEDREITNAGYGSNLTMDGTVECDATIVDHYGRSGAVGAASRKQTSFFSCFSRSPLYCLQLQSATVSTTDHFVPVAPLRTQ